MDESKDEKSERLTRQQAAERLTDVAYALTTGRSLRLAGDRQATVSVADEVVLKRENRSSGDRIELALVLSWPATGSDG